jgi:hypothetical protein
MSCQKREDASVPSTWTNWRSRFLMGQPNEESRMNYQANRTKKSQWPVLTKILLKYSTKFTYYYEKLKEDSSSRRCVTSRRKHHGFEVQTLAHANVHGFFPRGFYSKASWMAQSWEQGVSSATTCMASVDAHKLFCQLLARHWPGVFSIQKPGSRVAFMWNNQTDLVLRTTWPAIGPK